MWVDVTVFLSLSFFIKKKKKGARLQQNKFMFGLQSELFSDANDLKSQGRPNPVRGAEIQPGFPTYQVEKKSLLKKELFC